MTVRNLNNASVELWISDPWELGTECEDGPIGARIVRQSGEKISMRFEKSFHYAGKEIVGAVAQPRYVGETLFHLTKRGELVVGLHLTTDAPEAVSIFEMENQGIVAVGSIHVE